MGKPTPVIIIVAYNRPQSLLNLLHSISKAKYYSDVDVTLIVSIDYSGNNEVYDVAQNFLWKYGKKQIISHPERLGLKKHIISCGELSQKFGTVIILEDDVLVSPSFYYYAVEIITRYYSDDKIAGYGLYQYENNEASNLPHSVIEEGFDSYFMKVPCSSGQIWTDMQWHAFKTWLNEGQYITEYDYIPNNVKAWPETSWKKYFWKYLVDKDKYFTFPTKSFTTNSGDAGEHHKEVTIIHQSHLNLKKENFNFPDFDQTLNVYDQFFEILPIKCKISDLYKNNVEIDLHGTKDNHLIKKDFCISTRYCKKSIQNISFAVFPVQLNLVIGDFDSENDTICLGKTKDFEDELNIKYLEILSNKVSFNVKRMIESRIKQKTMRTDEFIIGLKWKKILNMLPVFIRKPIEKSILFRNNYAIKG